MPVPTPEDFLTGEAKRKREFSRNIGEDWNIRQVGTNLVGTYKPTATDTILASSPDRVGVTLRRAASQSIPDAAEASITWDTEDFDSHGFIAVPSTTITVPAGLGGVYVMTAIGQLPAEPTVSQYSYITAAGQVYLNSAAAVRRFYFITAVANLNAGNGVTFTVFQDHTGAQNFTGRFEMFRLGE